MNIKSILEYGETSKYRGHTLSPEFRRLLRGGQFVVGELSVFCTEIIDFFFFCKSITITDRYFVSDLRFTNTELVRERP